MLVQESNMVTSSMINRERKKHIVVVLIDRANYGRLSPVMSQLREDTRFRLSVVCGGSMVLERYGSAYLEVESDGFAIDRLLYFEVEGSKPASMAMTIGLAVTQFATVFQDLSPDMVLLIGDRYEALAAAIGAVYSNIPLAHVQGGEQSGTIDESTRHAITKLAHIHFPATQKASAILSQMGEADSSICLSGCPVGDYIINLAPLEPTDLNAYGVGYQFESSDWPMLVVFHPVTTDPEGAERDLKEVMKTVNEIGYPCVWIWPNIDSGSDRLSKIIRLEREKNRLSNVRFIKNLPAKLYQQVLKQSRVAIGNSSSFVRDSSFSGVPVVLTGNRQTARECAQNVVHWSFDKGSLLDVVKNAIQRGALEPDFLYGNGSASKRIVDHLAECEVDLQKKFIFKPAAFGV